jgi:hypothetical protein
MHALWRSSCCTFFAIANSKPTQFNHVTNIQFAKSYGNGVGGKARHWTEQLYALAHPELQVPGEIVAKTHAQSAIDSITRGLKMTGNIGDLVMALKKSEEITALLTKNKEEEKTKAKKKAEILKRKQEDRRKRVKSELRQNMMMVRGSMDSMRTPRATFDTDDIRNNVESFDEKFGLRKSMAPLRETMEEELLEVSNGEKSDDEVSRAC